MVDDLEYKLFTLPGHDYFTPYLDAIAEVLSESQNDILIMGHTDDTPVGNGAYPSNWELSLYRGISILDYFLATQLIDSDRLSVGGYGASRPLYLNKTPEKRTLNRRAEIIIKVL